MGNRNQYNKYNKSNISKTGKFSDEHCDYLNAKIYFKSDDKVSSIILNKSYKIKELYEDCDFKQKIIYLLTFKVNTLLFTKKVTEYMENNYFKSDAEIYEDLQLMNDVNNMNDCKNDITIDFKNSIKSYINVDVLDTMKYLDLGTFLDLEKPLSDLEKDIKEIINKDTMSEEFDFVTILMGLHLINSGNLGTLLDFVYRIIKKGGILIIKDHDMNPLIKLNTHLLDILYLFYRKSKNAKLDYQRNYNTKYYWDKKILNKGFKYIDIFNESISENAFANPLKIYTNAFVKI